MIRFNSTRTHNNMFGYRGVEWRQAKGKFAARIEPATGCRGRWLGYFSTAQEAAHAYDEAAREIYGAAAHLNFPRPGENQTHRSRLGEGVCAAGHNLAETGVIDSRGNLKCRRCNAASQARSRARRMVQLTRL